jgi:hypothetical protein
LFCVLYDGSRVTASADAATCFFYSVNVQGVAGSDYGGQQFALPGTATVVSPGLNGNPLNLFLYTAVGRDLNQFAQSGDIELMTNSAFARNFGISSVRFNLANVGVSNVVEFAVDFGIRFQQPPPNVFVAPGIGTFPGGLGGLGFLNDPFLSGLGQASILQLAYIVPRNGGGNFFFPDNQTISGNLNLGGSAIDFSIRRVSVRRRRHRGSGRNCSF